MFAIFRVLNPSPNDTPSAMFSGSGEPLAQPARLLRAKSPRLAFFSTGWSAAGPVTPALPGVAGAFTRRRLDKEAKCASYSLAGLVFFPRLRDAGFGSLERTRGVCPVLTPVPEASRRRSPRPPLSQPVYAERSLLL